MHSPKSPLPNSGFNRFSHLEKYPNHSNLFKAVDKSTLAPILIKRTKNFASSSKNIESAKRLQPILYSLDHPNVVKPIDFLLERRDLFSILEYIPNSAAISNVIVQRVVTNFVNLPVLDTTEISEVTNQLLCALQYLHEYPLGAITFHGVNCENILLTGCGVSIKCKLLDFAEAMMVDDITNRFGDKSSINSPMKSPASSTSSSFSSSIQTTQFDNASPERLRNIMGINQLNDIIDCSSDMWSLGATLLTIATSMKLSDLLEYSKRAMLYGYDDWSFERDVISAMSEKQLFLWRRQDEYVRLVISRCLRLTPTDRPSASSLLNLNIVLQSMPPNSPVRKTALSKKKESSCKNNRTSKSHNDKSETNLSAPEKLFSSPSPSTSSSCTELKHSHFPQAMVDYQNKELQKMGSSYIRYKNEEEESDICKSTSMNSEVFTSQRHDENIVSPSFITAIDASESMVAHFPRQIPKLSTLSSPPHADQQQFEIFVSSSPGIRINETEEKQAIANSSYFQSIVENFHNKLFMQKLNSNNGDDHNNGASLVTATSIGSATSVESPPLSDSSLVSVLNLNGPLEVIPSNSLPVISSHTSTIVTRESNERRPALSISNNLNNVQHQGIIQLKRNSTDTTQKLPEESSNEHRVYYKERSLIEFPSFSVVTMCWIALTQPLLSLNNHDCFSYILLATNGRMMNTIDLWEFDRELNMNCILTLTGHRNTIISLSPLSSDGGLLSTSQDGTVRVWHLSYQCIDGQFLLEYECSYVLQGPNSCAVLAAMQTHWYGRIGTGGSDGVISIWDPTPVNTSGFEEENGSYTDILKPMFQLLGHSDSVTSFAVISDIRIVSASLDRTLRMWHLETQQCLHVFRGHSQGITAVIACKNGQNFISAGEDDMLRVWDVTLKTGVYMVKHSHSNRTQGSGIRSGITGMSLLSDEKSLAVTGMDGCVSLWSVATNNTTNVPTPTVRQQLVSQLFSNYHFGNIEIPKRLAFLLVEESRRSNLMNANTRPFNIETGPLLVAGSSTHCSLACWT